MKSDHFICKNIAWIPSSSYKNYSIKRRENLGRREHYLENYFEVVQYTVNLQLLDDCIYVITLIVPIMSLFLHLHLVSIGIYSLSIRFTYAYLSLYTLTDFLCKHLLSAHWVLNIMLTLGGGGVCGAE